MTKREADEASIREVASVCVSALRVLSGAHQHLAIQIAQNELNMLDFLDQEEGARVAVTPVSVNPL